MLEIQTAVRDKAPQTALNGAQGKPKSKQWKRLLVTSVIAGIIVGILAGGFYNLFQVPVIERAIALEEERAASVSPPGSAEESGAEVSPGQSRYNTLFIMNISILDDKGKGR